ncbi:hypothetical protein IT412_00370 [Candidatus Peregrinibacteria bacterium]|nr:hypothetical protein [Candidatus Peregrinibacteria bacterium]
MNFEKIFADVFQALGTSTVVIGAYYFGKILPEQYSKPYWLNYLRIIGVTLFISFIMGSSYGSHYEDADPLYDGGEEVQDFETSNEDKFNYGLAIFLILTLPSLMGVSNGVTKEDAEKRKLEKLRAYMLLVEAENPVSNKPKGKK